MSLFDDLSVGDATTTQGRTITEADVVNFAGVSGDFNAIHTDAEAMADSAYGERIAHGALIFSVLSGLLWQSRDEDERREVVAFYGVDRLRFVAPVFVGDTIRAEFEVAGKEPRDRPPGTGIIRYETRVTNQDGDVVLACEVLSLVE